LQVGPHHTIATLHWDFSINARLTLISSYDNVLCVGAANKYYQRSTYSNYDKYVDIFAPGDEIRSAYNQAYDAYAFFTGTSYATPAVAGVLASYMKYENITDNATEVISRLMSNVQYGLLSEGSIPIPNVFAHTGLRHPDKKPECPYKDVTRVTCKGPGNHTDIGISPPTYMCLGYH
jgi:subtilisin family serine protease